MRPVRVLETHLGKRLFLRQGNRITLTDAGRAIYPRIELALTDLGAVTEDLREGRHRPRLVVSVLPSVAELWLAPVMSGFAPLGGIEIRVEDDPVSFARGAVDLRVTYGGHYYPDHEVERLLRDRIVAVAAPGFAVSGGGLDAAPDGMFIHTDWGPAFATQPSWAAWFASRRSARRPDAQDGIRVDRTGFAAAAARNGLGVALVPERIVGADLAAGRLVLADPHGLAMSWDYVMVWPKAIGRRPLLRALTAHLRAAALSSP
ncbi:LysR substrate-binding domain-containing protein [Defluviimonas sp. SAOS-178_SWC]|uniref:LysR substrate-binding domain-containing protein n=1 Tax=Defluviimonas sp. SAOS-178_SWC TaxID=3121287 RepID=UPI0032214231